MPHLLNDITQQFQSATVGWYGYLFPIANHLFAALAVIEIAWSSIWWALDEGSLTSLWSEFLKRIVSIGFFYAILIHGSTWIPAIIKSFMMLGAGASHIEKIDPSSVLSQGMSIAASVLVPLEHEQLWSNPLAFLIGGFTAVVVAVSYAVIAGELVVTLIESYFVVGAGVIFLGLGSSRWTTSYTTHFLSYAMNVGCKLFVLFLVVGVGVNMAMHWGEMIIQGGAQDMTPFIEVLGGSIVFVFITRSIPNKVSSLMNGSFHSSFSGIVNTAKTMHKATTMAAQAAITGARKLVIRK